MATWQVNEAKAHLSEVIDRACSEGPQTITRHGADRAVIISATEYQELIAKKVDFKSWLLGGPKLDDFVIDRDPDAGRNIAL